MELGFHHFAEKRPDFVALVDPQGKEWTRGELNVLVNRLTRALLGAGLRKGDTMAIVAPNCAEYLVAYLAASQAGLWIVTVNWHLAEEEIAFLLEDSAARVVIVHPDVGTKALAAVAQHGARADLLVSIGEAEGCIPLHELVAAYSAEPVGVPTYGRTMSYTSATTGRPKAVQRSGPEGRAVIEHIVAQNAAFGVFPEDDNVHLCASMLYHSAPFVGVETALHMGHRVILTGHWQPDLLLQLIDRYRVTTTFMVPAMFVRLLKLPAAVRERYSTASLRFVVHGAAPCPHDVKRQMIEWWGDAVWESYGSTEAAGTIVSAAEWLQRPGTVGRPMRGSAIKIMGEDGNELAPYEVGLIYILPRTGQKFEYKGDPEKTRQSYRGDYVTVGDLGYLDQEGYLFICGRSSELIISSGMNIYPAEIETVLAQHPLVRDCAVLGEPHAALGEVPKAFVELEPGTERGGLLTAELLHFVGKRLSAMKLPKRIEYVEQIPRDPSGKLYKRLLRERYRPDGARGAE
jgi:long-chain acyl-CoA synthetase